jgi:hypothetical protein
MTLPILAYFAIALGTLIALARMILLIGRSMGECPQTGRVARAAATSIATGFLAIGMGGVILIAATIPALDPRTSANQAIVVLFNAGLASLILGLGFTHALRTLRVILQDVRPVVTATSEPVLM